MSRRVRRSGAREPWSVRVARRIRLDGTTPLGMAGVLVAAVVVWALAWALVLLIDAIAAGWSL